MKIAGKLDNVIFSYANKLMLSTDVITILQQIGCAPLHVASELGNASIVTTLIDNGAIIDLPFQVIIIVIIQLLYLPLYIGVLIIS